MAPEVVRIIVDYCDLPTLLTLRLTSGDLGEHAENVLQSDRRGMLEHFVADADALWRHIENYKAVVGGVTALSFVLRDESMRPDVLEVYVTSEHAEFLEQMLDEDPELGLRLTEVVHQDPIKMLSTPRQTSRVATFRCPNGRYLKMLTSATQSVLDPIVMTPTTALMNWVSPFAFGCGYPFLTLRRRALSCSISRYTPGAAALFLTLKTHGFERMRSPWCWPEYTAQVPVTESTWFKPCMRSLYLCQNTKHEDLRALHQPPYGVAVAWRLWFGGQRPCDGICRCHDPLLPDGERSVAAVMVGQQIQFRTSFVGPVAE